MARTGFPTPTEIQLMQILRDAPRALSGAAIVRQGIKDGSVYVLLSRLEDKGFVNVTRKKSEYAGLERPYYRLSAKGLRALDYGRDLGALPAGI